MNVSRRDVQGKESGGGVEGKESKYGGEEMGLTSRGFE
jgi:hypothetical protein